MFKTAISAIILLAFILFAAINLDAGITNTKHNLSVTGPGDVKAAPGGTTEICVFCHTPHAASTANLGGGWKGPLWNHSLSAATYTLSIPGDPGVSSLQLSTPIQPDMGSKLCLSCHDGTVAIGALYNAPGPGGIYGSVAMTTTYMPSGRLTNLGTDIRTTHLVSIAYNDNLINDKNNNQCLQGLSSFRWRLPSSMPASSKIQLKNTTATYAGLSGYPSYNTPGRCTTCGVQCSTCHDPHSSTYPMFIVVNYRPENGGDSANLCEFCHRLDDGLCTNTW